MKGSRLLWFLIIFSSSAFALPFNPKSPIWVSDGGFDIGNSREALGREGIYLATHYVQDLDWPTRGGFKSTSYPLFLYLYALEAGVDFDKLIHVPGLRFYMDFLNHTGKSPTLNYVRDYQGFDNIEAYSLTQLAELWLEQDFFNHRFDIRFGKIDCYGVFIFTSFAQVLMNNSFSQFPTMLGYPSYPDSAVGIILNMRPTSFLTLRASIFDGSNAQGVRVGNLGAKRFFQNLGKHTLLINEANIQWQQNKYAGEFIFGVWGFNGRLVNFNGTTTGKAVGPFASISQVLWKQKEKKRASSRPFTPSTLGAFAQFGAANQKYANVKFFVAGGLSYENLFQPIDTDTFSIGATTAYFSQDPAAPFLQSYECSLEATYQFYLFKYLLVQPDIQWILNPGGVDRHNALVASLRLTFSL